eukprot:Blabericola_migrator_1__12961@NODE_858_length_6240_cov_61_647821_g608_i0_p7_GENE_NODE_858_length_6240_cov_61_647821_g608_i0NODE_858_length_6240_cov_61_647821_g608_i0_p7_ORF_typecomplete_len115_score8_65_NODE_858_length_6240_cov_61_647821_g608_i014201764
MQSLQPQNGGASGASSANASPRSGARSPGAAARYRAGRRSPAAVQSAEGPGLPPERIQQLREGEIAPSMCFLNTAVVSDYEKYKPLTQRVTDSGQGICLCPAMHDCQRAVSTLY